MEKQKQWFRCTLAKYPRFPYIARVYATSKTAAGRLFLNYLKDGNYHRQRSSISSVEITEIPEKKVTPELWGTVLGYEASDEPKE